MNDTAAGASPVQREVRPQKCGRPRCEGEMAPSVAMMPTYSGLPDFPGGSVVTMSPSGPGRVVGCWKCVVCGWSVTAA